ncbi:MAG: hypothetical protein ACRD0F_03690 [Acidimicrobiales bacterium]
MPTTPMPPLHTRRSAIAVGLAAAGLALVAFGVWLGTRNLATFSAQAPAQTPVDRAPVVLIAAPAASPEPRELVERVTVPASVAPRPAAPASAGPPSLIDPGPGDTSVASVPPAPAPPAEPQVVHQVTGLLGGLVQQLDDLLLGRPVLGLLPLDGLLRIG